MVEPLSAVGPVITAATLAWSVYKSCKAAPGSFKNISGEVLSLHAVLKEVEETLADQELSSSRQARLDTIANGCENVFEELQILLEKYESLGSQSKRTLDRLNWDAAEISELRARLTSNTVMLTAFMSTCQVVVEKKLDQLVKEYKDGKHEGSVLSNTTADSLDPDDKETWRTIRKELEDIGLTVEAFEANKRYIMDWVKEALLTGAFNEEIDSDDSGFHSDTNSVFSHTNDQAPVEEEIGNNAHVGKSVTEMPSIVNSPRVVKSPSGPKRASASGGAVGISSKSTRRLLSRLATLLTSEREDYDNMFIEAIAKNDWDRARELLAKGVNIDAKYTGTKSKIKEGTTALSLAYQQYNNPGKTDVRDRYVDIMRLLIEHGANPNTIVPYDYDREYYKYPILICVFKAQELELARLLVKKGADVNVADEYANFGSPLHRALFKQTNIDWDLVNLMLDRGADLEYMDYLWGTVLDMAVKLEHRQVIRFLVSRGAKNNYELYESYMDWAEDGHGTKRHVVNRQSIMESYKKLAAE